MRVIELSDHPGDMLHAVARQRQAASSRAREAHEQALIEHQAGIRTIQVRREQARREHRWWAWLRLALAVWAANRRAPQAGATVNAELTDTEQKIKAGIAGEQQVAAVLGQALAVRPASSLTSPPPSWNGSCASAASRSRSSAWWYSPTAAPGSASTATSPSTSAPRRATC